MVTPIEILSKIKPVSGFGAYLEISSKIDLHQDDPLDNPIQQGAKAAARGVLTFIAIPFFSWSSVVYNGVFGIAKCVLAGDGLLTKRNLFTGEVMVLDKDKRMLEEGVSHLANAVCDFCLSRFALPLAIGYGVFPEHISAFHQKAVEWINSRHLFPEGVSASPKGSSQESREKGQPFHLGHFLLEKMMRGAADHA